MNPHFKEMLSGDGALSLMRGMVTLVVVTGCYSIIHQLWFFDVVDFYGPTAVIVAGLGAKAAQKQIEVKRENGKSI